MRVFVKKEDESVCMLRRFGELREVDEAEYIKRTR